MSAAKDKRDALLDQLQQAFNEYAPAEKTRLENEVKFLLAVQQGRGATQTGTQNLASAASSVFDELGKYVRGF